MYRTTNKHVQVVEYSPLHTPLQLRVYRRVCVDEISSRNYYYFFVVLTYCVLTQGNIGRGATMCVAPRQIFVAPREIVVATRQIFVEILVAARKIFVAARQIFVAPRHIFIGAR